MSGPVILKADPTRPVFVLSLTILGCAAAGAALVIAVRLVAGPGRDLSNAAVASTRIAPVCALAFAYIRWGYVARTQLVINEAGLALRQPHAQWTAAWRDIASISPGGALIPTRRGGIGPAATLRLADGTTRAVPDVFGLRGTALADWLTEKRKQAALPGR